MTLRMFPRKKPLSRMTLRISGLAHVLYTTNLISVIRSLIMVPCVLCFLSGEAQAQDARTVYARLPFNVEGGKLYTGACLQVTERAYPSTPWWEDSQATGPSIDHAFKAVITAMKNKDRAALLRLTDPTEARDVPKFDMQANAFFSQLQSVRFVTVPRAYEFDGLVVFFGKIQTTSQAGFVPFVFARESNNSFGFLPSRSNTTTYKLVDDWFAPLGTPAVDTSAYCASSDVKRATHRVSLTSSAWHQSVLFLTGATSAITTRVKSTLDTMKTAFHEDKIDELLKHMTPLGGDRMKQWFVTASKEEGDRYTELFLEQKPFFVFDESPLIAVYTRTPTGMIQVLYFTVAPDTGRLLWTNSAYISASDRVFKAGPVFAAASSAKPFSGIAIR